MFPCENEDCEFQQTLAKGSHCDAESSCGGYYTDKNINCIDCVNWQGWECKGKCTKCVDFSEFKQKE